MVAQQRNGRVPSQGQVVGAVEVSALLSDGSPQALVLRNGDRKQVFEWPGQVLDVARLFSDPNRVAAGSLRFAGPESPKPPQRQPEQAGPTPEPTTSAELADLAMEAARVGKELGRLVEPVLGDDVLDALDEGRPVRIEMRIGTGDPAGRIPWEFLTIGGGRPLCLRDGGSLVRRVPSGRPRGVVERGSELTYGWLDLSELGRDDFKGPAAALAARGIAPTVAVDRVPTCDVLFIMGHGSEPGAGPALVARMEPTALVQQLDAVGWPEVIVLMACRSAEGAAGARSFAEYLAHEGAPAVVGMLGDIETTGQGAALLDGLLSALEAGAGLEDAVQSARVSMALQGSTLWQWGLPVLTVSADELLPQAPDSMFQVPRLDTLADQWRSVSVVKVTDSVVGEVTGTRGTLPGSSITVVDVNNSVVGSVVGHDFRNG